MTDTLTTTRTELLGTIARALKDPAATVAALVNLSDRAGTAEAEAGLAAADARARALDPALPPEIVSDALSEANRAAHDAARLSAARDALDALIGPRHEAVAEADRLQRRARAIAERDRVAARLTAEYPDLQRQMIDLLVEVMADVERIDAANRERSDSEEQLQRAEGMARGFFDKDAGQDAPYNFEILRLTQTILPDFSHTGKTAWPPNRTRDQMEQTGARPMRNAVIRTLVNLANKGGD